MEENKRNWYALKVFYNKVFEIESDLEDMGLETYIPVRKVQLKGEDHLRAARRLARARGLVPPFRLRGRERPSGDRPYRLWAGIRV